MFNRIFNKQIRLYSEKLNFLFSRSVSSKLQTAKNIGFGGYLLLSVPVATFALGTWQVKRRTWKLNLIEEVTNQNKAPPIELPENLEDLQTMEYKKVHVRGKFDHSKEMFIGPRQLLSESAEGTGLMSGRSQSGNLVITPFHVTDRDITILVNRGWVPRDRTNSSKRIEGQVSEEIDLVGTVRLHENRPQFSPKNQSNANYFYFRDVLRMAAMSGAALIFIDADETSTVPGGPIGGQTRMTFRNDHLSYILTWYSLSAATAYMWYKKYLHSPKLFV